MPKVLVVLAEGFEEIEAVSVIDILRRADIEVITAGLNERTVTGSHGISLVADTLFTDARDQSFDMIALPGGLPGADNLRDSNELRELLRSMADQDKKIAAICAAPQVLANADLLQGKKATSYPGFLDNTDASYQTDDVVVDGNITTSRGPATAMIFALELVEQLAGKSRREELETRMLLRDAG